jgi:hypothetical protein
MVKWLLLISGFWFSTINASTLSECAYDFISGAKVCDSPLEITHEKQGTLFLLGNYIKVRTVNGITCFIHLGAGTDADQDHALEPEAAAEYFNDETTAWESKGNVNFEVEIKNLSPDPLPDILGIKVGRRVRDGFGRPNDRLPPGTYLCRLFR